MEGKKKKETTEEEKRRGGQSFYFVLCHGSKWIDWLDLGRLLATVFIFIWRNFKGLFQFMNE